MVSITTFYFNRTLSMDNPNNNQEAMNTPNENEKPAASDLSSAAGSDLVGALRAMNDHIETLERIGGTGTITARTKAEADREKIVLAILS